MNAPVTDALILVSQYVWDGRLETQMHSFHYTAAAWRRHLDQPILLVNLLPWTRLTRWPRSFFRYLPGLHHTPDARIFMLNRWGPDWREESHRGRPVPVEPLAAAIRAAAARLRFQAPLLLTGDPAHTRLTGHCGEIASVYWVTDDLPAGDPRRAASMREDEDAAVRQADLVASVSQILLDRNRERARQSLLLPNAVDGTGLQMLARRPGPMPGGELPPGPRVVYLGYLNRRVDFPSLVDAATSRPAVTFLMIGPEQPGEAGVDDGLRALRALRNVRFLGRQDRPEVARVLSACDLGLIPYLDNDFNRACSPLKVLEYAALGLPVVATPLPALLPYASQIRLADGPDLARAIDEELAVAKLRKPALADLVVSETWEERVERLAFAVNGVLARLTGEEAPS